MNQSMFRVLLCGLLFVLTLISGVWVSSSGRPFNAAVFTVHKLIALATTVAVGFNVYRLYKEVDTRAFADAGLIGLTAIAFVSLFASGALLSSGRPAGSILLRLHQAAPVLALLSSTATAYLLRVPKP